MWFASVWWKASANLNWCLPCSKYIEKCKQKWRKKEKHLRCFRWNEMYINYFVLVWVYLRRNIFAFGAQIDTSRHSVWAECTRVHLACVSADSLLFFISFWHWQRVETSWNIRNLFSAQCKFDFRAQTRIAFQILISLSASRRRAYWCYVNSM